MKVFTTLVALAVVGLAYGDVVIDQEYKDAFVKIGQACAAESGASDADVAEFLTDGPASTMNGKCFKACIMKTFKTMNDAGKFDKQVLVDVIKMVTKNDAQLVQLANDVADACVGIAVPADKCEAADLYSTCLFKETKMSGFNAKLG